MRYARCQTRTAVAYGIVEGDRIRELEGDLFGRRTATGKTYKLSQVKLLAPTSATKILALAGNYPSHRDGRERSPAPGVFLKPPSCLIGHGESIVIPKGAAEVHHEGEMVIVIGKRARSVPLDEAMEHVLGVTCGNDVSARDWQDNDSQWWRAKGSDTFGPCGPWVVSGINYDNLVLCVRVNGDTVQEGSTNQMIFGVARIVTFLSQYVTLEPGDLIFTPDYSPTRPC